MVETQPPGNPGMPQKPALNIRRMVLILKCFDCNTQDVRIIDMDALTKGESKTATEVEKKTAQEETKKLIETMSLEQKHGLHRGFVVNQRIKDEQDIILINKELASWIK